MLKYVDTRVCFAEIPDEITLCINLSNCPCHCEGCHSPHLAEDIGSPLDEDAIVNLMLSNKGITCIAFMGGDLEPSSVDCWADLIRKMYTDDRDRGSWVDVKIAWYSGRQELPKEINLKNFDYIKLGPYIQERGPLNNPNTNQVLYQVVDGKLIDITHKFWKHETENQGKEDK